MNADEIVRALREAQEKYKHDIVSVGRIRIDAMARDCADLIERLHAQLAASQRRADAAAGALEQHKIDYICAVRHYNKYDSRYTFALPSQWYALEFSSFEDYQEFQMQLVYLLGEAKKKWDSRRRGPQEAEKGAEESR